MQQNNYILLFEGDFPRYFQNQTPPILLKKLKNVKLCPLAAEEGFAGKKHKIDILSLYPRYEVIPCPSSLAYRKW